MVDRGMLDSSTSIGLVFTLAVVVYALVAAAAGTLRGARLLAVIAGGAVILIWLIRGEFFTATEIAVTLVARRAGVMLAGAAAGLVYVAIRGARSGSPALRIICPILLAAGGALATANWIAAIATTIIAAAGAPRKQADQATA